MDLDWDRTHFRIRPGDLDPRLQDLMYRVATLTEDEVDRMTSPDVGTNFLESSVHQTGLDKDETWWFVRNLTAVQFGRTVSRLEPDYDHRDEWSMPRRLVTALRACWMRALALYAVDRLDAETCERLSRPWRLAFRSDSE